MESSGEFQESQFNPITVGGIDLQGWVTRIRPHVTYHLPFIIQDHQTIVTFGLSETILENTILFIPFMSKSIIVGAVLDNLFTSLMFGLFYLVTHEDPS